MLTGCIGASRASANESVCAKWEFGEPGDLKKCEAQQEKAQKAVWEFLSTFGIKTPLELEVANRQNRLIGILAQRCMVLGLGGAASDWTAVGNCIYEDAKSERAAGTDLSK